MTRYFYTARLHFAQIFHRYALVLCTFKTGIILLMFNKIRAYIKRKWYVMLLKYCISIGVGVQAPVVERKNNFFHIKVSNNACRWP